MSRLSRGTSAENLVLAIREHGHHDASYVADKTQLPEALDEIVRPGDVVIALGAGDINVALRELKKRLEHKEQAKAKLPRGGASMPP